jgi:hypothetical protein
MVMFNMAALPLNQVFFLMAVSGATISRRPLAGNVRLIIVRQATSDLDHFAHGATARVVPLTQRRRSNQWSAARDEAGIF